MNFSELLNKYCGILDCLNSELAKESGIDASAISRYRNGSRLPEEDSDAIEKLSNGLLALAKRRKHDDFPQDIAEKLREALAVKKKTEEIRNRHFIACINQVMDGLNIKNSDIAKAVVVDASYISRLRTGQRKPADLHVFALKFSKYLLENHFAEKDLAFYRELLKKEQNEITRKDFIVVFSEWLLNEKLKIDRPFDRFMAKLDTFDLQEYIRAIRFHDIKLVTSPLTIPTAKKYYGLAQMRTATVDFLKAIVLSRHKGELILHSDINVEILAEDVSFSKKWMFGLAMVIKKGMHINMIHCLDRSFNELMLGLENWIPLYMTGQVTPYYFKEKTNQVYCHTTFTGEAAALSGECVLGKEEKGLYYLTKKKDEITYYREKAGQLLAKAQPLMKIFRKENEQEYFAYCQSEGFQDCDWKHFLTSPSLYTMPEELFDSLMTRAGITEAEKQIMTGRYRKLKAFSSAHLIRHKIYEIINVVSEEEFRENPVKVHLSGIFLEADLKYTYDEYRRHLAEMERYRKEYQNYSYLAVEEAGYKNIQILICMGKSVIVSKNNAPIINFVIKHPKLREAFEDMVLPVRE